MEDFLLEKNTNIYQFWACILDSHYILYIVICTCSWYYTECGISAEKRKGIKRDEENRHDKQGLPLLSDEKKLHVTHEKVTLWRYWHLFWCSMRELLFIVKIFKGSLAHLTYLKLHETENMNIQISSIRSFNYLSLIRKELRWNNFFLHRFKYVKKQFTNTLIAPKDTL